MYRKLPWKFSHNRNLEKNSYTYTDVQISLHIVVVSHYNDYLDRLSYRQGRGEVTCWGRFLYVSWHKVMYANFQEKIFAEISEKNA